MNNHPNNRHLIKILNLTKTKASKKKSTTNISKLLLKKITVSTLVRTERLFHYREKRMGQSVAGNRPPSLIAEQEFF